jgi:hypothetical protein
MLTYNTTAYLSTEACSGMIYEPINKDRTTLMHSKNLGQAPQWSCQLWQRHVQEELNQVLYVSSATVEQAPLPMFTVKHTLQSQPALSHELATFIIFYFLGTSQWTNSTNPGENNCFQKAPMLSWPIGTRTCYQKNLPTLKATTNQDVPDMHFLINAKLKNNACKKKIQNCGHHQWFNDATVNFFHVHNPSTPRIISGF